MILEPGPSGAPARPAPRPAISVGGRHSQGGASGGGDIRRGAPPRGCPRPGATVGSAHPGAAIHPLFLVLLAGCLGRRVDAVAIDSLPTPAPERVVGVAHADITPPPGGVLAGHGPGGLRAAGVRGRLGCDVVYLGSGAEHFTWVTCDLAHTSTLLQRLVVARVREQAANPRCAAIGTDRLALSATHTHGAPGHHYAEASFGVKAPGPVDGCMPEDPGYDPGMVSFLVDRIASAVGDACEDARGPATLRWASGDIPDVVTRNRSLVAWCANPGAPGCPDDPSRAVGRHMDVLQVVRPTDGVDQTAAILAFFPIHPTAVGNGGDVLHADLFGPAREILRDTFPAPIEPGAVVAFVNGASGDLAPTEPHAPDSPPCTSCAETGHAFAARIGAALATGAITLLARPAPTEQDWTISRVTADIALTGGRPVTGEALGDYTRGPCDVGGRAWKRFPEDPAETLCLNAEIGTAAGAGAEDGQTIYRFGVFGFAEGDQDAGSGCHAPKAIVRDLPGTFGIPRLLSPTACAFSEAVPLTLVQIGSRRILTVPAEPTTMVGRHLAAAAADPAGTPAILATLTSGYIQYLTTAEEYATQQYEGGSTLYGPASGAFFTEKARLLAASLGEGGGTFQQSWPYRPDRLARRWRLRDPDGEPWAGRPARRDVTRVSRNGSRPEHAQVPYVPRGCPPLEITLPELGPAFWRHPDGWKVEVNDEIPPPTEVEVRILPQRPPLVLVVRRRLRTDDAHVAWAPAVCPAVGTRVELVVTPPTEVGPPTSRTAVFDDMGWVPVPE